MYWNEEWNMKGGIWEWKTGRAAESRTWVPFVCKCACSKILHLLWYMAKSTNHIPWCLLYDLLVPPLNGALSLIEVDLERYDDSLSPYSHYGYMC